VDESTVRIAGSREFHFAGPHNAENALLPNCVLVICMRAAVVLFFLDATVKWFKVDAQACTFYLDRHLYFTGWPKK